MITIRDADQPQGGVVHICIENRDSELADPVLRIMNKTDNTWLGVEGWTATPVNIRAAQQFVKDGTLVLVCGGTAISEVSEATPVVVEIPELNQLKGEGLWPPIQPGLDHVTVFDISSAGSVRTSAARRGPVSANAAAGADATEAASENEDVNETGPGGADAADQTGTNLSGPQDGEHTEDETTEDEVSDSAAVEDDNADEVSTGSPTETEDQSGTLPEEPRTPDLPAPTARRWSLISLAAAFLVGAVIGAGGLYAGWDYLQLGPDTDATAATFIAERDQLRADLADREDRLTELEAEIQQKIEAFRAAETARDAAQEALVQAQAETNHLRRKIIELNEKIEELNNRIEALSSQVPDQGLVDDLTRQLGAAETARDTLQAEAEALQTQIAALEARLRDGPTEDAVRALETEVETLRQVQRALEQDAFAPFPTDVFQTGPASPDGVDADEVARQDRSQQAQLFFRRADAARNDPERVYWYRLSARFGNYKAMFRLGEHYLSGAGVPLNQRVGVQLLRLSIAFNPNDTGLRNLVVRRLADLEGDHIPLGIEDDYRNR